MALHPVSTGQEKGKSTLIISTWWYEVVLCKIYLCQTALVELLVLLQELHFVVLYCNMSSQR